MDRTDWVVVPFFDDELEAKLNELGANGWDVYKIEPVPGYPTHNTAPSRIIARRSA